MDILQFLTIWNELRKIPAEPSVSIDTEIHRSGNYSSLMCDAGFTQIITDYNKGMRYSRQLDDTIEEIPIRNRNAG